ncbi:unnamed protein product [Darwinula stevensoni]|uniref:C2H2-type domain-containing protein n=1 Tax=Darwinula stevensoni TaxID=69355 RepID=A0A7R9AHD8_9CRUS|nr:unnamed protein product [Darwinula stevensoni]CAG0905252.1 unnamed protein product [Darwinula stevensoni]
MITSGGANQYLRPEYLSPLPTTLDAKKSPLALLAQTCSQIGADMSNSKPIIPPIEKKKDGASSGDRKGRNGSPHIDPKRLPEDQSSTSGEEEGRQLDDANYRASPDGNNNNKSSAGSPKASAAAPTDLSFKSSSSGKDSPREDGGGKSSPASSRQSPSAKTADASITSPYSRHLGSLGGYNGLGFFGFPTVDTSLHRSLAPFSQGYSPLLSPYARLKTGDLACRDPYCTGCQFMGAQLLAAAAAASSNNGCPRDCTQCERHKAAAAPTPSILAHRPYVCNWIVGETYCGKCFASSEELLQHLRTHTSPTTSDSAASLPLFPSLHHSFMNNPLYRYSQLSMARYHPYAKPPGVVAPPPLAPHPALGSLYPPLSFFPPR